MLHVVPIRQASFEKIHSYEMRTCLVVVQYSMLCGVRRNGQIGIKIGKEHGKGGFDDRAVKPWRTVLY